MDQSEKEQLSELTKIVTDLAGTVGGFDHKAARLEADIGELKQGLAVVKSNYATKADVLEAKNSIMMWLGAILIAQLAPVLHRMWGG